MNRFWEVGWVRTDFNEGGEAPMSKLTKKLLISIINLLRALIEFVTELID